MKVLVPVEDKVFAGLILHYLKAEHWPCETTFRILHVVHPIELAFCWPNETHLKEAEQLVTDVAEEFQHAMPDSNVETQVVHGPTARMILEQAESWPADFIAMGSHSRFGLGRRLLGSVSEEVADRSKCPVGVLMPSPRSSKDEQKAECFINGYRMSDQHQDYLAAHINDERFPLDGSDWSRLIQMRLQHEHKTGERACTECVDFLTRLHAAESPLSHDSNSIKWALHHWFITGGGASEEKPAAQILRNLSAKPQNLTVEQAEQDWLSFGRRNRASENGRYWIAGRGEAFESPKQLPDRLSKQALANKLIETKKPRAGAD